MKQLLPGRFFSLPETNRKCPLKNDGFSKFGISKLPGVDFQVRTVSFREGYFIGPFSGLEVGDSVF